MGAALLLAAYVTSSSVWLDLGMALLGAVACLAGLSGSSRSFLPSRKLAERLDAVLFAVSDAVQALDALAARKRLF